MKELFTIRQLIRAGSGNGAVTVKEKNDLNLVTFCECATGSIPSAVAGYAVGCLLIDTTTGKVYTNQNTAASCTFNSVGDITSAELADSIDLGSSGAAGDLDIFPTTASKGKLAISATDSTGNTTTSITNAAQAGARTYTIPDAGASASFVMTEGAQSIAGVKTFTDGIVCEDGEFKLGAGAGTAVTATAAELNYLDLAALGTGAASKAVVLDAGDDYVWPPTGILTYGVLKDPAGTTLTATAAEINAHCAVASIGQTITTSGAVTAGKMSVLLNHTTVAIAATIADASLHFGYFVVKAGLEPGGGQDHTCVITTGTWDGVNKTATFADINDALVVFFDHAGNGTIISNTGAVAMS